jgi:two-component system sensor histidine kinase KdpD
MSDEILAFARTRNVSKIVVGKPERPRWKRIAMGSIVDTLVQGSGEIDVYVISGDRDDSRPPPPRPWPRETEWGPYGAAAAAVGAATAIAWAMHARFALSNLIMVYLLAVIVVATRYGRGPSLLASLLSVAAFDFFFVPPYFTFAVSDTEYLVTFAVMLVVALVISSLAVRIRAQAESARERERRMAALYAMSRELASTRGVDRLQEVAVRHIAELFRTEGVVLLPQPDGRLAPEPAEAARFPWIRASWRSASGCTSTARSRARAPIPCPAPPGSTCR